MNIKKRPKKDAIIGIRMPAKEVMELEVEAIQKGYESVSSYLRNIIRERKKDAGVS